MKTNANRLTHLSRPVRSLPRANHPGLLPRNPRLSAILAEFKEHLLHQSTLETANELIAKSYRLAAAEAEALAWETPFPLLFLPVLLEEKLESVRRYNGLQWYVRSR